MICADAAPRTRRGAETVGVDEALGFGEIIDARSPAEFAEDHLPGAINLPVLNNEERARIGTLHKQASAFEAKKAGAALVSRNIARHLETVLGDKPRNYRPLVYCWRGGNRSGAFVTVLRAIGWNAAQLEGGYKSFRRHVIAELETLPGRFDFWVVCGPTGVGKSRFLRALGECGGQVLDLEDMAAHMDRCWGPIRTAPSRPRNCSKPGSGTPCAASIRAAGVRRIGKQEDRQPAYSGKPAGADAGRRLLQPERGHHRAGGPAQAGVRPFPERCRIPQ